MDAAYFHLICAFFVWIVFLFFLTEAKYYSKIFRDEIPENSFWRKLIKKIAPRFREDKNNPLRYGKLIPFIVTSVILFALLIVYGVYWICPPLLTDFLHSRLSMWLSIIYMLVAVLYGAAY